MPISSRGCRGYSLIELLVVLTIVAVLAAVGVSMIGNRGSGSVRSILDELEGTLASAHQSASATGRDVLLVTRGDWSTTNPLIMAYGTASAPTTATITTSILTTGATASEAFRVAVGPNGLLREHLNAGVVTQANSAFWDSAQTGSTAITGVPPFNDSTSGFNGILALTGENLFQGGTAANAVRISGSNKRFTTTFWIKVVAMANGEPVAGGPMGLIVVLANGATIYKFYNPGVLSGGNGAWRRI